MLIVKKDVGKLKKVALLDYLQHSYNPDGDVQVNCLPEYMNLHLMNAGNQKSRLFYETLV